MQQGFGRDAAYAFAEQGALVSIGVLAHHMEDSKEVEAKLKEINPENMMLECDVTNEESVKNFVEQVFNKFGRIDILINNAGVAVRGGVHELTQEDWDKSMNVNVKGVYLMSKYVIPHMINQKYGKVVNIASVNAVVADKDDIFIRHGYNASKAAVVGLTRGMACSYAKYGITVNAVGPALFESGMTKDTLFKSEPFLAAYSHLNPTSRPGNHGELNGTLMYLATDASSYVNGQFIIVDGGGTLV